MPFPSTLSAGNLTSIRSTSYRANQYIALCPNTVIFQALVNGAPSGDSFAQVTFDGTSVGAYTDIVIGQTVYISPTTSISDAIFVGRVRKTPTSTILYINETSAAIGDNYSIFVTNDYRLWEKLARVVGSSYYKDWDLTYAAPSPIIAGIQSAYAGVVSGSPEGYTIAFAATATAVASGATISSYSYAIGDGTVTAGSASTANVTIRFPAGFRWISLTVTDSGGRSTILRIPIWAVPTDLSSVVTLGFEGAEISADLEGGFNATIPAFTGISSVLDNTLCCVFDVEYYGTTAESIVTNVKFVGRLRTESDDNQPDEQANRVQSTRFEVEGMGGQLARTAAPLIKMINDSSPTVWDEITNLTFWRAMCFVLQTHSTFLTISSLSFDSTANTFLYPSLPTRGDSLWDVLQDLMESINAVAEFATSGEMRINRDARYLTSTERDALVTVAAFEMQDVLAFTLDHDHIDDVGQIKAYGGTFNGGTNKETTVAAFWPGSAQGSGQGREVLNRQVLAANVSKLAAQAELNRRIGYKGAIDNTRDVLSVEFPDGYNFLIPSSYTWYTFTIASTDDLRGIAFTTATRWLCESITVSHDNGSGSKSVSARFIRETASTDGKTYNPPAPGSITPYLPGIPPINTFPSFPDLGITLPEDGGGFPFPNLTPDLNANLPTDGNLVLPCTASAIYATTNFLASQTPDWNDITPDGLAENIIRDKIDPFGRGAYLLTGGDQWCYEFDFTATNGSWTTRSVFSGTPGSYSGGTGWVHGDFRSSASSAFYRGVEIERTFSAATITSIEMEFNLTKGSYVTSSDYGVVRIESPSPTIRAQILRSAAVSGSGQTLTFTGLITQSSISLFLHSSVQGSASYSGSATITKVTITGTGVNPFGVDNCSTTGASYVWECPDAFVNEPEWTQGASPGNGYRWLAPTSTQDALYAYSPVATTTYSTDRGATWATAEAVGASPGANGGINAIRIGAAVLAGADNQVMIATTAGGTYSAYGSAMPALADPTAIYIPRYQFGSTTVSNAGTSTPQYLVASRTLTAGNAALWKVTSSGTVFTNITPVSGGQYGRATGSGCLAMPWQSGSIILYVALFGSDVKLAVSVNGGTSWAFSAALDPDASQVVLRKSDSNMRQAWIANGVSGVGYVANYRAATPTVSNRAIPTTDAVISVDVYG